MPSRTIISSTNANTPTNAPAPARAAAESTFLAMSERIVRALRCM